MSNETLEKAEKIKYCIEQLKALKAVFESDIQLSVNQIATYGLTGDIMDSWKELNVDFLDDCIKEMEKEFKKL